MVQSTTLSYSAAARGTSKRSAAHNNFFQEETATQRKLGQFTPSKEYLEFLNKRYSFKTAGQACPKSSMLHGIRLYTGILNDYKVKELAAQLSAVFPNAMSAIDSHYRGFMDIGFATEEEADSASLALITSGDKPVRIARTRHKDDDSIFISFYQLPTTVPRQVLIQALKKGLVEYGTVLKFEMEESILMPHLSAPRAFAVLKPTQQVTEDITIIPRCAFVYDQEGKATLNFQVRPERAPPVCGHCSFIGHRANACPKTVEGLRRIMQQNEESDMSMDEELEANSNSAKYGYPWGENSEYNLITPVSSQERAAAKRALAEETKTARIQEKAETVKAINQTLKSNTSTTHLETTTNQTTKPTGTFSTSSQNSFDTLENFSPEDPISATPYPTRSQTALKTARQGSADAAVAGHR